MLLSAQRTIPDSFSATCTASESVGDFVRVLPSGAVATVDIDATPTQLAIGVVVSKETITTCVVRRSGTLNTSGLAVGASYYVGPSGAAATLPARPVSGLRTMQSVGHALGTTTLLLAISTKPSRVRPL